MRDFPNPPVQQERWTVRQHTFDQHLKDGRWQVSLCTKSSIGVYSGPKGAYDRFTLQGKCVLDAQALPRPVLDLLASLGYAEA